MGPDPTFEEHIHRGALLCEHGPAFRHGLAFRNWRGDAAFAERALEPFRRYAGADQVGVRFDEIESAVAERDLIASIEQDESHGQVIGGAGQTRQQTLLLWRHFRNTSRECFLLNSAVVAQKDPGIVQSRRSTEAENAAGAGASIGIGP